MGSSPGASRLLSLYALRTFPPAREGRLRGARNARGRWLLPAARPAAAQRATILHRRRSLAIVPSGRDTAGPAGTASAALGRSRPGPKFYARLPLHGAQTR